MIELRYIPILLSILWSIETLGLAVASETTDANEFYGEFRSLVLENKRELVVDLFKYPLSDEIKSKDDLRRLYDDVFNEHLLSLIECTSGENISQVGWRGHMLLNGVLWIDGVYLGDIHPDKESPSYFEEIDAQLDDEEHWYMRVYGVNQGIGECPKSS
ncbi:hypothetical protein KUV95_17180 [Microbulbifer agarilyticus]|uniref:hypothetical protein n=1 Tax=Microbulbifer agarilyticus TaxID=260552 RepID=UPI001C98139E|nr:hypothetical protein [Microbulbifer agarilyticus]MBY6213279.1 hypothetical protein [Microbulbifer agarilyticus]